MKDKSKGITLIALVITIIILLILAGITIIQLQENGLFQKAQRAGEITNEVTAKEELETKVYEVQIEKEGNATLQDLVNYLDEDKENNYVISLTKTAKVTGVTNIGEATEIYVLYKGYEFKISGNLKIEVVGKSASSGNQSGNGGSQGGNDENQGGSGSGEETKGIANEPNVSKIAQKTYVTWNLNEAGIEYEINDTQTTPPSDWYDYENGKWANIKTSEYGADAYWVWIPRYEYIIPTSTTATEIEVKFIPTSQTEADSGYTIHPTFTSAGNGGFGELDGIWVAKFEASTNSSNLNDSKSWLFVKPDSKSWNAIQAKTAFQVCRELTQPARPLSSSTVDSHLMKNMEWGAVAILSQSKYGIYNNQSNIEDPENGFRRVWNNPNYGPETSGMRGVRTGYAGIDPDAYVKDTSVFGYTKPTVFPYNTSEGTHASTSGTVYGIYDMAAGLQEMVAGCFEGKEKQLFGVELGEAKYVDLYSNSFKVGDANMSESRWNNDVNIGPTTSYPLIIRGGNLTGASQAGIFTAQRRSSGDPEAYTGFRPVLIP